MAGRHHVLCTVLLHLSGTAGGNKAEGTAAPAVLQLWHAMCRVIMAWHAHHYLLQSLCMLKMQLGSSCQHSGRTYLPIKHRPVMPIIRWTSCTLLAANNT